MWPILNVRLMPKAFVNLRIEASEILEWLRTVGRNESHLVWKPYARVYFKKEIHVLREQVHAHTLFEIFREVFKNFCLNLI